MSPPPPIAKLPHCPVAKIPPGSRLAALPSQSERFPLTRSPAFAYKDLARLEIEMASPAEYPKAVCGEASRRTRNASPLSCAFDRPDFFAPTGHHAGECWPHAARAAQRARACSSVRTHLRYLCIGQSPLFMKHGDEIGRAAHDLRSCF